MSNVILIRYGEPSKYDHGPYGSICKVIKAMEEKNDIYVQLSTEESMPQWSFVGSFAPQSDEEITAQIQEILNK